MFTLQDALKQRQADDDAFWTKHPGQLAFKAPEALPDPRIGVLMREGKHVHYIIVNHEPVYGTVDELMQKLH
jgi:hypothetical protein